MSILVTGGSFDVLHKNHKGFLNKLIHLTEPNKLIILLNSDQKIIQRKGEHRPLFEFRWRYLDLKKWAEETYPGLSVEIIETFLDNIEEVYPYINNPGYVIGTKYYYQTYRSRIHNLVTVEELEGHHTSDIINKVKEAEDNCRCHLIKVGCVLVREGEIVSVAHNGDIKKYLSPTLLNCSKCEIEKSNKCDYYHAEEVALKEAKEGDDLFVSYSPCLSCARQIVERGIRRVVFFRDYVHPQGTEYLISNGVKIRRAGLCQNNNI